MAELQRKGLVENVLWLTLSNVIMKPVWLVFLVLLARLLGPESYGEFCYFLTFAFFLCLVMDLGIDAVITREVAKDHAVTVEYFSAFFALRALAGGFAFLLAVFAIFFFSQSESAHLLYFACAAQVILVLLMFVRSFFRAFERLDYEAWSSIAEKFFAAILGIAAVLVVGNLISVFTSLLVGYGVALGLSLILLRRLVPLRPVVVSMSRLKTMLLPALPFALMNIFTLFYFRSDILLLGYLKGNVEVGIYQGAFRFIESLLFLPALVAAPVYPRLTRLFAFNYKEGILLVTRLSKWLLSGAMVITFILFVFSDSVIVTLLGQEFQQSSEIFTLLVWCFPFAILIFLYGTVLASLGYQSISTLIAGLAVALNLAMNFTFIPSMGGRGAAIAALSTNAFLGTANLLAAHRKMGVRSFPDHYLKLGSTIVAGIFLWYLTLNIEAISESLRAAGIIIFSSALLVKMKFWDASDLQRILLSIKGILKRI